jgi:hypothetical protein
MFQQEHKQVLKLEASSRKRNVVFVYIINCSEQHHVATLSSWLLLYFEIMKHLQFQGKQIFVLSLCHYIIYRATCELILFSSLIYFLVGFNLL